MDPASLSISQRSAYCVPVIAELDYKLDRRLPESTIGAQCALATIDIVWIGS
jgi:hypothetical protein